MNVAADAGFGVGVNVVVDVVDVAVGDVEVIVAHLVDEVAGDAGS